MDSKQLLSALVQARKLAGLTCKQMGDKLGISEAQYNRYEKGITDFPLKTFLAAQELLKPQLEMLDNAIFQLPTSRTKVGRIDPQNAPFARDKPLIINIGKCIVGNPIFSTRPFFMNGLFYCQILPPVMSSTFVEKQRLNKPFLKIIRYF
jgi:transcriptional regulator with XRE-family HTH domain